MSLEAIELLLADAVHAVVPVAGTDQWQAMAKGQKRSSRESKKPKKAKLKAPATATSTVNAKLNQSGRGRISSGARCATRSAIMP